MEIRCKTRPAIIPLMRLMTLQGLITLKYRDLSNLEGVVRLSYYILLLGSKLSFKLIDSRSQPSIPFC